MDLTTARALLITTKKATNQKQPVKKPMPRNTTTKKTNLKKNMMETVVIMTMKRAMFGDDGDAMNQVVWGMSCISIRCPVLRVLVVRYNSASRFSVPEGRSPSQAIRIPPMGPGPCLALHALGPAMVAGI